MRSWTGPAVRIFARVMGFADHDPVTPDRRADWFDKRNRIEEVLGKHALKMRRFLKDHPEYAGGTVGAAAVDSRGVLAAATSTGGVTLKMVGRVGDSPVPGAGNYACARIAASATGTGEFVLRSLATRAIAERVERGERLAAAMEAVLDGLGRDYDADVGLIAVDDAGTPVARHRTRDMPHAWFSGNGPVAARMRT